jgi:hypothetical protein
MGAAWTSRHLERPLRTAFAVYLFATLVFAVFAQTELWSSHTPYNHFALLAHGWLNGRLDLPSPPPPYSGGNDFAYYGGRWFVVFPGFPALLLVPWVSLAGEPARVLDGAFFLVLAGLAPAVFYLTLHRIRSLGIAPLSPAVVLACPLLYAFGTVYFFTAVQGTVWFAAHVVSAVATCAFLWASIGARHPVLAGVALSAVLATRPPLIVLGAFFLAELYRATRKDEGRGIDHWLLAKRFSGFVLPVAVTVSILAALNVARFGEPTEFGYRYLSIAWKTRIERHGLFGYHYLARNLGVLLTNLPYVHFDEGKLVFRINGHGLPLWMTSPFYLWLLWPQRTTALHRAIYVTLPLCALPSLLYQNSGWLQFGQRFSNDYAPLLVLLLALGGFARTRWLTTACVVAVCVNAFGAWSFGRPSASGFYYVERTQRVIYEPD